MLVRCPECKTEIRLVGPEGDERVVRYLCSTCDRIVCIDLRLDEVDSSSSAGTFRDLPRRPTVLVADDTAPSLRLAEELLLQEGYRVLRATDGEEALEKISRHHPDLVVLDLLMPRMTGFDVMRAMERDERLKGIPVVAVSGVTRDDVLPFVRERGADSFVEKKRLRERLVVEARQLLRTDAAS